MCSDCNNEDDIAQHIETVHKDSTKTGEEVKEAVLSMEQNEQGSLDSQEMQCEECRLILKDRDDMEAHNQAEHKVNEKEQEVIEEKEQEVIEEKEQEVIVEKEQ